MSLATAAGQAIVLEPVWPVRFGAADRMDVQDAAIRAVQADPAPFYARFAALPQALGGYFVSADTFKETFDAYQGNPAHRQRYNAPLHNTCAVLAHAWLRCLLRQPREPGREAVIFITGVSGAGKTSAVLAAARARDGAPPSPAEPGRLPWPRPAQRPPPLPPPQALATCHPSRAHACALRRAPEQAGQA
jgi:hypothetical protein